MGRVGGGAVGSPLLTILTVGEDEVWVGIFCCEGVGEGETEGAVIMPMKGTEPLVGVGLLF